MGRLELLRAELDGDPRGLGYRGLDDAACAKLLNQVGLSGDTRERTLVDTWEILAAVEVADLKTLTAMQRELFQLLLSCGRANVQHQRIRAMAGDLFAGKSATLQNLAALQTEPVSRGEKIGVGVVESWDVGQARNLVIA